MAREESLPETIELDSLREFDAIAKPFRLAIFKALRVPLSVGELAQAFEVPVTRLYYHVNELEKLNLIQQVDVRKVNSRSEKVYQALGRGATPSAKFLEEYGRDGVVAVVRLLFGLAEAGMSEAVVAGEVVLENTEESLRTGTVGLWSTSLSPEDQGRLIDDLESLLSRYRDKVDDDGRSVAFFYGIYPERATEK